MKLRPRLALTTVALMLPLAALFAWVDGQVRERAASDVLVADAMAQLDDDARSRVRGVSRSVGPEHPGAAEGRAAWWASAGRSARRSSPKAAPSNRRRSPAADRS